MSSEGQERQGRLEVIMGGTKSGKTEELVRRVRRADIANQNVVVFVPSTEDGQEDLRIVSHDGKSWQAIPVPMGQPEKILDFLESQQEAVDVIAVDAGHLFSSGFANMINALGEGYRVIVAGLDVDSDGVTCNEIAQLACQAEEVQKLHAICIVCGDEASVSQAIQSDSDIVYEPRCRPHYQSTIISGE